MRKSNLREFRKLHRLTQYELREKSGIVQSRISQLETGTARPSPREREALSHALSVPDALLFGA